MIRFAAAAALSFLVAACTDDVALSTSSAASARECEVFVCGDNAATAGDGVLFDEINLEPGVPNYVGTKLLGAYQGSHPVEMDIFGDRLRGRDLVTGAWLDGPPLVGTIMKLQSASGQILEVKVDDYDQGTLRFRAGTNLGIPTYLLRWRKQGDFQFTEYVCDRDPLDSEWSPRGRWALVYRGDRYDAATKRVIESDANNTWGFIACAGSGGWKMHINRHTLAGSEAGVVATTLEQRTTLMKAITADYCGNNEAAFTVRGNPLRYTAAAPFSMPGLGTISSYEAVWGPDGAICLDMPRRDPSRIVPDPSNLRYTAQMVSDKCQRTIPACGAWAWWWPWLGYAITANP